MDEQKLAELQEMLHREADKIKDTLGLDSVVIIVTSTTGNATQRFSGMAGNIYANIGAMMETLDSYTSADE